MLKGYTINNRMNRIEDNIESINKKINQIDLQLNTQLIPNQGVFFDGQVFDAYELTSKIIRSAKSHIVLIDNYMNEETIALLSKKERQVKVSLLTKNISKTFALDVKKANEQYGDFEIQNFEKSHDRFLIIDQTEVYHLGASLKDLGKKWFAFTKMNKTSVESILNSIGKQRS